jgi:hypothetical protein
MLDYQRSTRRELRTLLAAAMMLGGCLGTPEADPPPPIDSGCIDCDRFIEDPCADGGCDEPPTEPPFRLGEGGEMRLERFQDSADDSQQTLAAQAFFFKGQEPGARAFGEQLPLRQEPLEKGYSCLDRRNGAYFDNGKTAEGQVIADTRAYYDVGATATLTSTGASSQVITLQRFLSSDAPGGGIDPSSGLQHDVLYRGDAAQRIQRNTTYRPSIAGSFEYPALDLKWGETAVGEPLANAVTGEGTPQIYMPSAFVLTSPTEEEFFTPGFLRFTRGQDLTLTYTAEPRPAGWPSVLPYVSFVDDEGRVAAFCIKTPFAGSGDSDDGEFTVPYEVLDIAPPSGRLVFGRLVHAAWEYTVDASRLDLIGMESKRSPPYAIQDLPARAR